MSNMPDNPLAGSVAASDSLTRALYRQMVRVVGGMAPYAPSERIDAARRALTVFGACRTTDGVRSDVAVFNAAVRAFERLFDSVTAYDPTSPTPMHDFVQRIASETGASDIAIHDLLEYAVTTPFSGPTVDGLAAEELLYCATCGKTLCGADRFTVAGCISCEGREGVTPRYALGCAVGALCEVSESYRFLLDTGVGAPPTPYEGSFAYNNPHWGTVYATMAQVLRHLGQLASHDTRRAVSLSLRLLGACNVNCDAPEDEQVRTRGNVLDCVNTSFSALIDEIYGRALSSHPFNDALGAIAVRCGVEPARLTSVCRVAGSTSTAFDTAWENIYDVMDYIVCARCSSRARSRLRVWLENGGCADCKTNMIVCPHCGRYALYEECDDLGDLAMCCWSPIEWCRECGGHGAPKEGLTLQVHKWPNNVLVRPPSPSVVARKIREEILCEVRRRRYTAGCWGKESLSFGVEIECGLRDTRGLESLGWNVGTDGSLKGLSYPVELTAGPLLYGEFDAFIDDSERWLRYGTTNKSCGFHLHVGRLRNRLTWFEVYRLMAYHKMYEGWFFATQPEHRRDSCWCEPMVAPAKVHTKREFLRALYGDDDVVRSSRGRKHPAHGSWLKTRRWFNVQSWMYRRTIEIRLHEGTCAVSKILAWKELFAHTFEHALKVSPWKWRAPWQVLPKPVLDAIERRIELYSDSYHVRTCEYDVETFFGEGAMRRVV